MTDHLWSETCCSTFKYLIILIISTNYIFLHLLDNNVFNSRLHLTDSLNCSVMLKTALLTCMWYMFLICRDIKLDNILLDEELADFGLAAVGVYQRMALSSAHGTECYCAPEVIFVFTFPYDLFIFCWVLVLCINVIVMLSEFLSFIMFIEHINIYIHLIV